MRYLIPRIADLLKRMPTKHEWVKRLDGWDMKRFTISNLLLIVTWCAIVMLFVSRQFAISPYEGLTDDIEGTIFFAYGLEEDVETEIDKEAVRKSPRWDPAYENPPVSARAALLIANQFRRDSLRDNALWEWRLAYITLYPIDGKNNKWCWCIRFAAHAKKGGYSGRPPEFAVFVLMNGKIVMPKFNKSDFLKESGLMKDDEP